VRASAIVVHFPRAKESAQVLFADSDEEIQALAAETAAEPFTTCVRLWRLDRRPEDADAHCRHSRIEPG